MCVKLKNYEQKYCFKNQFMLILLRIITDYLQNNWYYYKIIG